LENAAQGAHAPLCPRLPPPLLMSMEQLQIAMQNSMAIGRQVYEKVDIILQKEK